MGFYLSTPAQTLYQNHSCSLMSSQAEAHFEPVLRRYGLWLMFSRPCSCSRRNCKTSTAPLYFQSISRRQTYNFFWFLQLRPCSLLCDHSQSGRCGLVADTCRASFWRCSGLRLSSTFSNPSRSSRFCSESWGFASCSSANDCICSCFYYWRRCCRAPPEWADPSSCRWSPWFWRPLVSAGDSTTFKNK